VNTREERIKLCIEKFWQIFHNDAYNTVWSDTTLI